ISEGGKARRAGMVTAGRARAVRAESLLGRSGRAGGDGQCRRRRPRVSPIRRLDHAPGDRSRREPKAMRSCRRAAGASSSAHPQQRGTPVTDHRHVSETHLADRASPLGMALAGPGFRSAFFHVGVLAQLARLGVLRRIEVLSTVSGGALVGVLYYLHLKNLLENKSDVEITDA